MYLNDSTSKSQSHALTFLSVWTSLSPANGDSPLNLKNKGFSNSDSDSPLNLKKKDFKIFEGRISVLRFWLELVC